MSQAVTMDEEGLAQFAIQRDELVEGVSQALRETLFESRAFIRPVDLRRLADLEVDAFLDFLARDDRAMAVAHGSELCRLGVGEQAVLRIGPVYRQACSSQTTEALRLSCLGAVDRYVTAMLLGFIREREAIVLEEQERIRSALQKTLHRYTLQIETAAEVARTAVSTLDLGELLTTAVDLIGARFDLDYVGIYLVDESEPYAVLRAGTGMEGRRRLAAGHKLKIGGASAVGTCILTRQHAIVEGTADGDLQLDTSRVPSALSEMAVPLIAGGRVVAALSVQSHTAASFSTQDVPGLQIMADQLANAIENAWLYSSARGRADELAVAYAQLKELDRLKDRFMQNVSHELRTPLAVISGYGEALSQAQMGSLSPQQQEAVDIICRSSRSLLELVTDIMAVLEVQARRRTSSWASMTELARMCVSNYQLMAADKGLQLSIDLPSEDGGLVVEADADHVRRVLENLLSNAIKFTPSGGHVRLRLWQNDSQVFAEVSDTGIGIPLEMQDRVFDRFFQVDSSIRRRHGGTGLGLSLVKEMVESYGGTVTVSSLGTNRGSTFSISLPRAYEEIIREQEWIAEA